MRMGLIRLFGILAISWGSATVLAQFRMIPHVTRVGGGFDTTFYLENTEQETGVYQLQAFSMDGRMLGIVSGSIPAGLVQRFTVADLFASTAEVSHVLILEGTQHIEVSVAYCKDSGAGSPAHVRESSVQARRWRIFPGDWSVAWDGFAVVQTGDQSADVWVRHYDFRDTLIKSVKFLEALEPASKGLYVLSTDFDDIPDSYFEISSEANLAITALRGTLDHVTLWENAALALEPREEPAPAFDKWSLWSGETQLRGANIWQGRNVMEVYGGDIGNDPLGPPVTQEELNQLRSLGCNYVNLSHPGLFTVDPPYQVDPDVQANLDELLTKIARADMYAVFTARTGPGRSEFDIHPGDNYEHNPEGGWYPSSLNRHLLWSDATAQAAWADMWRYTANRYKDNAIVVGYELLCEGNPEEVFHGIWLEPQEYYPQYAGTLEDWNQIYPPIVTAIREVDTETAILISPIGYSDIRWLPYLTPSTARHVVYSIHQYEPFELTHQYEVPTPNGYPGVFEVCCVSGPQTINKSWLNNLLGIVDEVKIANNAFVSVTEFGPMRFVTGADAYMNDLLDLFEQRSLNYALWEWHLSYPGQVENDAFAFMHGPDPNNHSNVTSDLRDVIENYWSRNTQYPSTEP